MQFEEKLSALIDDEVNKRVMAAFLQLAETETSEEVYKNFKKACGKSCGTVITDLFMYAVDSGDVKPKLKNLSGKSPSYSSGIGELLFESKTDRYLVVLNGKK